MSFLLRKLWFRKRSSSEKELGSASMLDENSDSSLEDQDRYPRLRPPNVTFTSHPVSCHYKPPETEILVNQVAALAVRVSNNTNTEPQNEEPSTHFTEEGGIEPAEEETFHYLTSLITVSYQQTPTHTPASSVSISTSNGSRKSQIFDRKRASSVLSLTDLPASSSSFPSLLKGSRKQSPTRYSPLPPPFVQKALFMRPEVRF